ncbi:MAG: Sucrose-6-phosphate hydrolase [Verrucomicrobiota bacterium]|jgi:beta-fructofuranosidase
MKRERVPLYFALLALCWFGLVAWGDDGGFEPIFDGRSLEGWGAADMSYWTVEEGAITARITDEHQLKENLYLIWQGGDLADFELKLRHRVFGSEGINCGFQFRSREMENHDVAGYQVDNNLNTDWLVRLYDEHGRHTLAWRGERSVFNERGEVVKGEIGEAKGDAWFRLEEWHEYHLVCVGTRLTLFVDGRLVAEVEDGDPGQQDFAGILALQLHTGPPTVAQFKDIRLKVLKEAPVREASGVESGGVLRDKTLVAWVSPANLEQRGGSVLTLDDGQENFDGLVFGELAKGRWMAGSEFYRRTWREQEAWPRETVLGGELVQVAAVYVGDRVSLYRNAELMAEYTMPGAPRSFGPAAAVLFGRRHLEAGDPQNAFVGRIRDARIYGRGLLAGELGELRAGELGGLEPWAWWDFAGEGLRERTGRFREIQLVGDVRIVDGCLELGGDGATVITTCSGGEGGAQVEVPRQWSASGVVPGEVVQSARLLRERFLEDPYRPGYHFCVPEDMGMPGDPNGAFFANGRYHLMYLYNRTGSGFCWGHISSADLLHWRHHPDAIGPGDGDEGCFSGGAFVDEDGAAYLSYWMLWGARGIGLARSEGPDYADWTKLESNPVVASTEWGVTEVVGQGGRSFHYGSADPSNIWKEGGVYYMLTGNLLVLNKYGRGEDALLEDQGDRLYLMASEDLREWEYRGVFYERNPEWTDRSEDNMCPSFLPLPSGPEGGEASGKHLLLFISHNKGCQYYVGEYRGERFYPERHGRMTWVDNTYFASEALVDDRGRQIMWAWLLDNPEGEKERGWSGVYGLPRSLWLGADGTLRMRPVEELERLRVGVQEWVGGGLEDGEVRWLEGVRGESCEVEVRGDIGRARRVGVKVRVSAGGEEETLVYYDAEGGQLVMDTTRSGGDGRRVVERAPFELAEGEPLQLRVFVDKSVVEVFANDRQAIGRRVYPTRSDSVGVGVFAEGGRTGDGRVTAWEMVPSNPY